MTSTDAKTIERLARESADLARRALVKTNELEAYLGLLDYRAGKSQRDKIYPRILPLFARCMRRVFFASRFEKKLKIFHSRHPEFSAAIEAAVTAIAKDPHVSSLHTHRLKGPLSDCFASRLSREYRIIFVLAADRVTFIDVGTHDDVYR
jgi:mRNA interferase YafQ